MDRQELVNRLAELHEDLSRTEHADPETLELLQKLTADMGRLLGEKQLPPAAEVEPVSRGLRSLLLTFEAEHPELSVALGKVADALAAIGI
jgi:hypothetical protein